GERPKLPRDFTVAVRKRQHGAPLDHQNAGFGDRLRGKPVLLAELEAEDLARQMERGDLPAPVVEQLADADRAADHLVEIFGRLAFAVDLHVARIRHSRTHEVERAGDGVAGLVPDRELPGGLPGYLIRGAHQHGLSLRNAIDAHW